MSMSMTLKAILDYNTPDFETFRWSLKLNGSETRLSEKNLTSEKRPIFFGFGVFDPDPKYFFQHLDLHSVFHPMVPRHLAKRQFVPRHHLKHLA